MSALVFEGGGVLAASYVGFIRGMRENAPEFAPKYLVGSSAGAMFAAFLALGATPDYIEEKFANTNIADFARSGGVLRDAYHFVTKYGLYSGDYLTRWITQCIEELGSIRTFAQLYEKTGITLIITGTNLATSEPEYFHYRSRPDMEIALALRISGSLTGIFEPVCYDGVYWTDGGLTENFPIDAVRIFGDIPVIAVHIISDINQRRRIGGILSYIRACFVAMVNNGHTREYLQLAPNLRIANIRTSRVHPANFELSPEDFASLVACGKLAADQFWRLCDQPVTHE